MLYFNLLKDIRFWIFFFFIIRLYGITNPPLEVSHNWRQVAGIMVAKNFLETDNSILFPRVDDAGSKTGIVSMEYPLLYYTMYIAYTIFGYTDWYGRLINLIVSSIGILFFYKTINYLFNKQIAFFSAIALLCSIYFCFSRKTMSDTFSISLIFIGIYYGFIYMKEKKIIQLILFICFCSIGALCKIPSVFLLCIFIIPIFSQPLKNNLAIITGLIAVCLCVGWWYFYWDHELRTAFDYSLWNSKQNTIANGWHALISHPNETAKKFCFEACSYSGFIIFIFGLLYSFKKRDKLLMVSFSILTLAFILFMLKAGRFFYHHNYYVIPYVSVMCLFIGYFLAQIKNTKIAYVLLAFITIENIANQQHDFRIKKSELYKTTLKPIVEKHIPPNTKIAINGGVNPQLLFFSYRKGWSLTNQQINDESVLHKIKGENCKYLVIDKNSFYEILPHSILFQNKNFIIYQL